ncbi:hypothetical protein ACFQ07_07680, partial [Actinomadura adrarensis]
MSPPPHEDRDGPRMIGPYRIRTVLGRDGSGTRFLAERDGEEYVLRLLDSLGEESRASVTEALAALQGLDSPHIADYV